MSQPLSLSSKLSLKSLTSRLRNKFDNSSPEGAKREHGSQRSRSSSCGSSYDDLPRLEPMRSMNSTTSSESSSSSTPAAKVVSPSVSEVTTPNASASGKAGVSLIVGFQLPF